jgi:hypothetical protein
MLRMKKHKERFLLTQLKQWDINNEIEWTEFYLREIEYSKAFHSSRLIELYKQRDDWWARFLNYCNTPVWKLQKAVEAPTKITKYV